jgi:Bacteriophage tail sheath protein
MTVPISYPGVYITEIPSGSRTIVGVATSITAFIGAASRGPVDVPVTIFSFADFERTFGGLSRDSGLGYAVRDFYQNGGGEALIVRLVHMAVNQDGKIIDTDPTSAATATLDVGGLEMAAIGPGTWGNALQVEVSYPSAADAKDVADAQGVADEDLFSLVVRDGAPDGGGLEETFLNVTVVDGPARVDTVLAASRLVQVTQTAAELPTSRPAVGPDGPNGPEGPWTVLDEGKGRDGDPLVATDYVSNDATKPGLNALLQADLFNLLCIPPPTLEADVDATVWSAAKALCFKQRAFLIVDPPSDAALTGDNSLTDEDSLASLLAGQDARNAAMYFPRIRSADPLRGGAIGDFAACGAIAGVYARIDGSRGVWKAPAGVDAALSGVAGLTSTLTDAENGLLNPKGINVLRTFRGTGSVVWGARTLRGSDALADDYKYVPVRRLALYLEETLYRSTQWVVFEPNDAPLWAQIRTSIGAFMQDLFRRGAFQGATPREAFFVRCDADTTTQYDIDRGVVNILVGFAPLKPAEFVVISIQQQTASASA